MRRSSRVTLGRGWHAAVGGWGGSGGMKCGQVIWGNPFDRKSEVRSLLQNRRLGKDFKINSARVGFNSD